jgi:small multidrug resistance family-3 protein
MLAEPGRLLGRCAGRVGFENFGRVYAAYGGVFVVLSIFWGWAVDKVSPDRFDLIGGLICLIGVAVIMYSPR